MPKGQYNRETIGTYYAICTHSECGLLVPVPINVYQMDPTGAVTAEPDYTQAREHNATHLDYNELLNDTIPGYKETE